jgi:hypothetical protein
MCGVPDIDVADWKRHTDYLGDFHRQGANHPVGRTVDSEMAVFI